MHKAVEFKLEECFVVVVWRHVESDVERVRRSVRKLHSTYEGALAEIGPLLDGGSRGVYATIEKRYS